MNIMDDQELDKHLWERLDAPDVIFNMIKQKTILYMTVYPLDEAIDRAIAEWNETKRFVEKYWNVYFFGG